MDLEKQKVKSDEKWLCREVDLWHSTIMDVYTTTIRYKSVMKVMERKDWIWYGQGIIENDLVSLKILQHTWYEFSIRISFYKENK